jgi:acyl-CoA thioester hydrolase
VNVKLKSAHEDGSHWSFIHEFTTTNGETAATVPVDGAWIDLKKRKLMALPDQFEETVLSIPRSHVFALTPMKT